MHYLCILMLSCSIRAQFGAFDQISGDMGDAYDDILGGTVVDDVLSGMDADDWDVVADITGDDDFKDLVDGI